MHNKNNIGDASIEEFQKYGHELIDWVAGYLKNIENYPVLPNIKPGDIKKRLPENPPEKGEPLSEILADIDKIVMPGMTHWQHPSFMAYFNSTASGAGILGEILSAAFNTNGMLWKSAPASNEIEEVTINWFRQLIGLPNYFWGIIYDTASVSSMHAIAAAREYNQNLQIRQKGMINKELPKLRLYASEQAHSSIDKAALTLGIGLEGIRKIPVDNEFKMIPEELEKAIREDKQNGWLPFCVTATIGTTSTTSIDPVELIAPICRKENIWLHVDAAHAGVIAMVPEMKFILKGVEQADSFVVNPHKWMFVPIDLSLLYTKHPKILKSAFSLVPEYLKTAEDDLVNNYMDYGIQLGRRFRSLKFWFVMRYFGKEGLIAVYREHLRLGKLFASWIDNDPNFERLAPVPFSTVCFRAVPTKLKTEEELNKFNERLINEINSTGKLFLSHTKLNGVFTIRLVVSGLRTTEKHVYAAWDVIRKTFDSLLKSYRN
ncbi:aspartate aminotransferase family protein [Melioribacteraceae bacterium 4301-Me]|uniref:pyridoxal phosphate-dependent decarboxylase family protein n=1 Tax=Pyranulibacter aquaticus TaxID=3163344 RepID=UPI003597F920